MLSILFTNNTLSRRAGSELWVRDMCRALVGRGHRAVAFSLVVGAVAEDLRLATVPVVTDLNQVGFTPDVIHGHHHVETLIAALHFPGVPIVHFCHGWLPWEEAPLRHPSIVRYVAVDTTCADRLIAENGIPADRVDLLLNFVDLQRFQPRPPLPDRPRRALILNNEADEDGYASFIREACRDHGIEVELAGARSGRCVERPQDLMSGFDLVFAKARAALEAMAVGCSVILADGVGCGPLVTEQQFDRMRAGNFGVRWLQHAHTTDWYRSQIAAYDAAEAGRISARVRQEADLETAANRLLDIYSHVIAEHESTEHESAEPSDAPILPIVVDSQRAAARHLSALALRFKQAQELDGTVNTLSRELAATRDDRDRILAAFTATQAALVAAHAAVDRVNCDLAAARTDHDDVVRENEAMLSQLVALTNRVTALRDERSALTEEVAAARTRNAQQHAAEHDRNVMLTAQVQILNTNVQTLSSELAVANEAGERIGREHLVLMTQAGTLADELAAVRHLHVMVIEERDRLQQLLAAYQALPTLRLRDALVRLPILGGAAQRTARRAARWLTRQPQTR